MTDYTEADRAGARGCIAYLTRGTRTGIRSAVKARHVTGDRLPWIFRCAACGQWHAVFASSDPRAEGGRMYAVFAGRRRRATR